MQAIQFEARLASCKVLQNLNLASADLRGIPFVFSTGYELDTMLPPHLAGSVIIQKPCQVSDLEQSIRRVLALATHTP